MAELVMLSRLSSSFRGSWSQLQKCIPSVSAQWRAQYSEASVEHALEGRRDQMEGGGAWNTASFRASPARNMEGYWNQFGLQKEYKKLSKLLKGNS